MPILYMREREKMKVNYQIGCKMWKGKTKKKWNEMTRKNIRRQMHPIPFIVRKQQRKTPFWCRLSESKK